MIRTFLAAMLIAVSAAAGAQTVQSCDSVSWDYPADKLSSIDGFRVYVNGAQAGSVPPSQQSIACSDIGLNNSGIFVVTATAYNAVAESPQSSPLSVAVVTSPPPAPTNLSAN